MKVTVVGSHLCPYTLYALNELIGATIHVDFKNLSASLQDLKEYLSLRDDLEIYSEIGNMGRLGIPCFILEDGTKTLDLNEVL
ncbi:glutaredoxin [Clostridioides sp. ES-S-0048-02]|uniref:glutaredoxin n=1 Tax=Clostridioides sp. ES-S-0048-02 TaxID=2770777 RepID=UPI001D102C06|nr:glutaredoxin [Clostridioides sp. ES-S-0048-02]